MSLSLGGCVKPKKDGPAKTDGKKDLVPANVDYGAGHTLVFQADDPKSPPSFSVAWTKGGLAVAEGAVKTGHLVEPWGHLYTNGKESSAYRADTGDADRADKRLNMDGHVRLRSLDKTQTLTSDHGEYRGGLGIVRAMGNVVVTGPFGTLSGVPELWATPDLRIIGTPDMVSQKLKTPALLALAATASLGSPRFQKGTTYDVENQGPTIIENLDAGRRWTIKPAKPGPLVFKMPDRGMVIESSGTVVIDFVPKGTDVRHLTTVGKVHVVQTTKDGITTMDGKDAVYDWDWKAKAETADLQLAGPVTIVKTAKVKNAAKALVDQTTTTKGDQGSAVLVNKPKAGEDGIRSATLVGHVTLDVSEVDGQSFSGAGARMVYTPSGATARVDATGDVRMVRTSKDKDGTSRTVTQGDRGSAVLFSKPEAGANPLKGAVLNGSVAIDVSGSNGDVFKGSGDRLVYDAEGEKGVATMTGALKFSSEAQDYVGNLADLDTAVMTIGKKGWERVETSKSDGSPTRTTIDLKPSALKGAKPKKKGGKP